MTTSAQHINNMLINISHCKNLIELKQILLSYAPDHNITDPEILDLISHLTAACDRVVDICGQHSVKTLNDQEQLEFAEICDIIDNNRFKYHFQPIVNAKNGEIYSFEALMRPQSDICRNPLQVLKYARLSDRLAILEGLTFINILNIFNDNSDKFSGKKIFINSIPEAVLSETDLNIVSTIIKQYPDNIVIEMTEQSELSDDKLKEIKNLYNELNMRLAIDDYGTGYSNIQNLFRYTPDYVKIDRSLISDVHNDTKKQHFVREIIEFCRENNILVLAEGVETREEMHILITLGIDLIQGYYTGKPSETIINSIDKTIKDEIIKFRQERENGFKSHVYKATKFDRIHIDKLSLESYTHIIIPEYTDSDIIITNRILTVTNITIQISDNFKGHITFDNVSITSLKNKPCLDIGNNCELTLTVIGNNVLKNGGIRVPESSVFKYNGTGGLKILINGAGYYAIGNDENSKHGVIILEHGVTIENIASIGVCIGSGLGGEINILRGQFFITKRGHMGVAIGAVNADSNITLFACDMNITMNLSVGVAIGSLVGNSNIIIQHSSITSSLSGTELISMGSSATGNTDINISESGIIIDMASDVCAALAALNGSTLVNIEKSNMQMTITGDKARIFGLPDKTLTTCLNSMFDANITTNLKLHEDIDINNILITGGRTKIIHNQSNILDI